MTEAMTIVEQEMPVVPVNVSQGGLEAAIAMGDLERLNPGDRLKYYAAICQTCGLNPLTKPFEYIKLDGKLTLYANKGAAEQLRKIHKVTIKAIERRKEMGCYIVTVRGETPDGRADESSAAIATVYPARFYDKRGGVWKDHPKAGQEFGPEDMAGAIMKGETKAKRRLTLSIVGLGMLDEAEVSDVKRAQVERVTDAVTATELASDLNQNLLAEPSDDGASEMDHAIQEPEPPKAAINPPEPAIKPAKPAISEPVELPIDAPKPKAVAGQLDPDLLAKVTEAMPKDPNTEARAYTWMVANKWLTSEQAMAENPLVFITEAQAQKIINRPAAFMRAIGITA